MWILRPSFLCSCNGKPHFHLVTVYFREKPGPCSAIVTSTVEIYTLIHGAKKSGLCHSTVSRGLENSVPRRVGNVYSVLWTREQSWIAKFQQGRRGRNEPPTLENISPIVSIFFCETNANSPFSSGWQWQASGTDIHSKVINLLVVINIFQTLPASCVSFIKSLCAPQPDTESCSCWFTSFNFGIINN